MKSLIKCTENIENIKQISRWKFAAWKSVFLDKVLSVKGLENVKHKKLFLDLHKTLFRSKAAAAKKTQLIDSLFSVFDCSSVVFCSVSTRSHLSAFRTLASSVWTFSLHSQKYNSFTRMKNTEQFSNKSN